MNNIPNHTKDEQPPPREEPRISTAGGKTDSVAPSSPMEKVSESSQNPDNTQKLHDLSKSRRRQVAPPQEFTAMGHSKRRLQSFASSESSQEGLSCWSGNKSSSPNQKNSMIGQRRGLSGRVRTNNSTPSRTLEAEALVRFEEINELVRAETSGSLPIDEEGQSTQVQHQQNGNGQKSAYISSAQLIEQKLIDAASAPVHDSSGNKSRYPGQVNLDGEELLVPVATGIAMDKPGAIRVTEGRFTELHEAEHPSNSAIQSCLNHDRSTPSEQTLVQPGSMHVRGIMDGTRDAPSFDSSQLEDGLYSEEAEIDVPVAVAAQRTEDMRNEIAAEIKKEYQDQLELQQQKHQQPIATSGPITTAEVIGHYDDSSEAAATLQSRKHIYICVAILMVLLVVAATVVGIVVGVGASPDPDNDADPNNNMPASQSPVAITTTAPTSTSTISSVPSQFPSSSNAPTIFVFNQTDEFLRLAELLKPTLLGSPTFINQSDFEDPKTASYLTLDWMANEDPETIRIFEMPVAEERRDRLLLERYSLACMYHKLGGDQWFNDHKFMSDISVCGWFTPPHFGSTCNSAGFVASLDLPTNNLVGASIPNEAFHLIDLQNLYLEGNDIGGTIPPLIGDSKLAHFWMFNTRLEGTIPTELGLLSNTLEKFVVFETLMSGTIPTEVGLLKRFTNFHIGGNQMRGPIPSELGLVSTLKEVRLFSNDFTGTVPAELSALTNLSIFDIPGTLITGNLDPIFCSADNVFQDLTVFWSMCRKSPLDNIPSLVVCSCCTTCCNLDGPETCLPQAPPSSLPECANNGCITCDTNVFAPWCDMCPFVDNDGNTIPDGGQVNGDTNITQLCYGACSWNSTTDICESRTEFGLEL